MLNATCTKETPWTVRTPIIVYGNKGVVLWTGDGYYVRMKVENVGRTRAEKVQVSAQKLAKRGPDNEFVDIPTILPLNMKWSNSPPGETLAILDGISPQMSAFCDIVALVDPANPHQRKPAAIAPNTTVGQLQLEVDPFTESHLLPPGTYRLNLRIAAANAKLVDTVFDFTHTGPWLQNDADMRRDCLAVSLK